MKEKSFSEKNVFHSLRSTKRKEASGKKKGDKNRVRQILLSPLKRYNTEYYLTFIDSEKGYNESCSCGIPIALIDKLTKWSSTYCR